MRSEQAIGNSISPDWERGFSDTERDLLREVAVALRSIRYGSVVLTVHNGRVVEVNKTERIRKNAPG